jgi:hypothetical protein
MQCVQHPEDLEHQIDQLHGIFDLTNLPQVKVPVLSEQRTVVQPRVSMLARFLTMIRDFRRHEMIANANATQRGKPCGKYLVNWCVTPVK